MKNEHDPGTVGVHKITGTGLMRLACSYTINADSNISLKKVYQCEHSPMRTQLFVVEMQDIPTFVSVHFVRHKHGVEHFVKSNREDRASYTGDLGRWQPVNHMMLCNAQALVNMARKRLCRKASEETTEVMEAIVAAVGKEDAALAERMVPECEYRRGCREIKTCGLYDKRHPLREQFKTEYPEMWEE